MAIAPDRFTRFAAIDWSGAKGPFQPGLALALCEAGRAAPRLIAPPTRAWSRAGLRDWIAAEADRGERTLIGLDLSPALPFADRGAYLPGWSRSPPDARALWHLVEAICADTADLGAGGFVEHPDAAPHFRHATGAGALFEAGRGRLRVCEHRQRERRGLSPSSTFNLVGAAQVGKSSLTGMRVLAALDGRVPVWPFDPLPPDGPVIVEIYTSIAALDAGRPPGRAKMRDPAALDAALAGVGSNPHAALLRYDDHATDAILSAAWLRHRWRDASLWHPPGMEAVAHTEGWTFGVP